MKSFVVLAVLVAAALAAPASVGPDAQAQIEKLENDNIGTGPFIFSYKTSNGIDASVEGRPIFPGTENEAVAQSGRFSYPGPDGVLYTVEWNADENGFNARGAHLPVAPQQ